MPRRPSACDVGAMSLASVVAALGFARGIQVDRATPRPPGPQAAPSIVEYRLPREGAFPHDPAVASDGSVWYTDQSNSYIGRLDPTTGKVTDYPTPTRGSGPHGIVVAPDGAVWYTANNAGRLGRVDPTSGAIKEFVLPSEARDPHTPLVYQGKVWFTAQESNLYGYLDTAGGQVKLFPIATRNAKPYGLRSEERRVGKEC